MKEKGYENWQSDHQKGKALIFLHILPTNSLKNNQIGLENLYVDIAA